MGIAALHQVLHIFQKTMGHSQIVNSLVNAFETFLLLSYVKLLSVSIDILLPSLLWEPSYACRGLVVFHDGTLDYCGREYLPYMPFWPSQFFWCSHSSPSCSSVSIYPCGWFQRLLNKYHLQRQALNTFIDAFQGSFNDVTNGTRDCRCFAALFLIIRVVAYLLLGLPLIVLSYSLLVDALLLMGVMLSLFSPYKNSLYTKLDTVFLAVLVVFILSLWSIHDYNAQLVEYAERLVLYGLAPLQISYLPLVTSTNAAE